MYQQTVAGLPLPRTEIDNHPTSEPENIKQISEFNRLGPQNVQLTLNREHHPIPQFSYLRKSEEVIFVQEYQN